MELLPSEAAAKVQQVTMVQFRSNLPPPACWFCHEFVSAEENQPIRLFAVRSRKALPFLPLSHPIPLSPFFFLPHSFPPSFFFFSPLFSFTPLFSFLTAATPHQEVIPAPPPGPAPTPLRLGNFNGASLSGKSGGGGWERGTGWGLTSGEFCRQNLLTWVTRLSNRVELPGKLQNK